MTRIKSEIIEEHITMAPNESQEKLRGMYACLRKVTPNPSSTAPKQ